MDETKHDSRPVSWIEDLTELIQRKKAENEILKKIGSDLVPQVQDTDHQKEDAEVQKDTETQV